MCKKVVHSRTSLMRHKNENPNCRTGREYHCRCCQEGFANRSLLDVHYKETICGVSDLTHEVRTGCRAKYIFS